MKAVVVLFVIVVVALHLSSTQTTSRTSKRKKSCEELYPYSKQEVHELLMKKEFQKIPRNYKCYMQCFQKRNGEIKNGNFTEKAKERYRAGCHFLELNCDHIDDCVNNYVGGERCEMAFSLYECVVTEYMDFLIDFAKHENIILAL